MLHDAVVGIIGVAIIYALFWLWDCFWILLGKLDDLIALLTFKRPRDRRWLEKIADEMRKRAIKEHDRWLMEDQRRKDQGEVSPESPP